MTSKCSVKTFKKGLAKVFRSLREGIQNNEYISVALYLVVGLLVLLIGFWCFVQIGVLAGFAKMHLLDNPFDTTVVPLFVLPVNFESDAMWIVFDEGMTVIGPVIGFCTLLGVTAMLCFHICKLGSSEEDGDQDEPSVTQ
ncbi:MAG: hypothetical protein RSD49_17495 [Hafnia sp.]